MSTEMEANNNTEQQLDIYDSGSGSNINNNNQPQTLREKLKTAVFSPYHKPELRSILTLAWPVVVLNISNFAYNLTNMVFMGRLGDTSYLAAASLGNTVQFGLIAIIYGASTAIDTLVAQAYGAKNNYVIGIIIQTAMVILMALATIISVLMFFTLPFLNLVGQDPIVAELCAQYVQYLIPGNFAIAIFQVLSKYLQCQNIMLPCMFAGIAANFVNAGLNYVLIYGIGSWSGLGFIGSPIATSISRSVQTILMLWIIYQWGYHKSTWHGLKLREALSRKTLASFGKLAVPGSLMLTFEAWGFEITTLISGLLNNPHVSLAAHSILLNITTVTYMIPMGVSIAANIRVGNLLGEGKIAQTRSAASMGILTGATVMVLCGLILISTKDVLGSVYSNDTAVVDMVSAVVPIAAAFQVFDGIQTVCGAILRGMGRQVVGAVLNAIAFYVIGLPIGSLLGFVANMQLFGLWIGLLLGLFTVASVSISLIIFRTDLEEESRKARARVGAVDVELTATPSTATLDALPAVEIEVDGGLAAASDRTDAVFSIRQSKTQSESSNDDDYRSDQQHKLVRIKETQQQQQQKQPQKQQQQQQEEDIDNDTVEYDKTAASKGKQRLLE